MCAGSSQHGSDMSVAGHRRRHRQLARSLAAHTCIYTGIGLLSVSHSDQRSEGNTQCFGGEPCRPPAPPLLPCHAQAVEWVPWGGALSAWYLQKLRSQRRGADVPPGGCKQHGHARTAVTAAQTGTIATTCGCLVARVMGMGAGVKWMWETRGLRQLSGRRRPPQPPGESRPPRLGRRCKKGFLNPRLRAHRFPFSRFPLDSRPGTTSRAAAMAATWWEEAAEGAAQRGGNGQVR